ncbi:MAG TPA: CehA/McbA family metallohydrolase [Planctomycetota bacterium]|nr:CehA/McbA family metallohydrolase [Planctomycetota bacterium]
MHYQPLKLAAFYNAGSELLPEGRVLPGGGKLWHGIPFLLGPSSAPKKGLLRKKKAKPSAIAVGRGARTEPLEIPIKSNARHIIIAHRLIDSKMVSEGEPAGKACADYVFVYDDGTSVGVPVRERLEIATVPANWGLWPMLAVPDQKDHLMPRDKGEWGAIGFRQTEAQQGNARDYFLYPWTNPLPQKKVAAIRVIPHGPRFIIGAITLSHLEEFPFNRAAKRNVKIVLPKKDDAKKPLEVEVDRGVASYPYSLPEKRAEQFLADAMKGYGEKQNWTTNPSFVEIAATPSATVTVKQEGKNLGAVNWGELQKKKKIKASPRLEMMLVDEGRNWVKTTVVDDATGRPIPCRVHFRSRDGIPFQPHGHHHFVNQNLGSWHSDIGGDVRLGQITYAYINGKCEGWLPRGEVIVDIARGFEYAPIREKITIQPGQQDLTFRLKKTRDMARERYFSGDTHVHFLSTQGSHLEAAGEGLNVVNLLLSQWGHLFTNTEEFIGGPSVSPDGKTIVYATQENRQHMLGHLTLLGLKEPVYPWCTDGPSESEIGTNLETTLCRWADACHAQGGTVVLPHIPTPNCEPAALIATGRVDAAEFLISETFNVTEYYRYLNCGYKLPLVGGTDKMSSDVPVGLYRTYVYIPDDEPFTYDNWCKHLKAGNTFQSGGPLLTIKVDGQPMGATVDLPGNGGTVEVEVQADSILPMVSIEVVMNGAVVAKTEEKQGARSMRLKARLKVERHSWIAARCGGAETYLKSPTHHDCWQRRISAHTSPVYIAVGGDWWMFDPGTASYMLTLIKGGLEYIHKRSVQWGKGTVSHSHRQEDHEKYLSEPFQQAINAIHKRMHELNIPH